MQKDLISRNVYAIAGPNGAGKTTFAREFLPLTIFDEERYNIITRPGERGVHEKTR
jgi:ABC-type multidrug transport system ATPase subunit